MWEKQSISTHPPTNSPTMFRNHMRRWKMRSKVWKNMENHNKCTWRPFSFSSLVLLSQVAFFSLNCFLPSFSPSFLLLPPKLFLLHVPILLYVSTFPSHLATQKTTHFQSHLPTQNNSLAGWSEKGIKIILLSDGVYSIIN